MKYLFPCVMLLGGIGLIFFGQALVGVMLAFFACVTYTEAVESDKDGNNE